MTTQLRTFSPSHLNDFLECEHLAALGLAVSRGELVRPDEDDLQAELIRRKGGEHERAYLAQLRDQWKSVLVVDTDDRDWERAARITADAIRGGSHDVIYQGVFIDPDGWRGVADFIERQADGSYEVADTKFARHSKPYSCSSSRSTPSSSGGCRRLPERMHVVLGTNDRESFRVADFIAYYRRVRTRLLEFVKHPRERWGPRALGGAQLKEIP